MMQLENQMHQQMMSDNDFEELGPELLKQAQEMGLDEEELRQLVQQNMYQELNDGDVGDEQEESNEEQHNEMYSGNENDEQNILRGEQNITDGDQEEADSHAVRQLQQHDRDEDGANDDMDDGEDHGEDDEDQLIDIAGLEDHEKAILLQYLHDEYQKNPDQLPMPKEVVAQLLAENKDMVEGLDRHHELMPGQQQ